MPSFVCASSFCTAGAGPKPITRGATPAVAKPITRASGTRPARAAPASLASSSAAAPSLTPDELPAVTVPCLRNAGFRPASVSSVVSARGCSSWRTCSVSPFLRPATVTGAISTSSSPCALARAARCWLRSAKASWSAREMPCASATFSAVSPIASVPCSASMRGLMKRQPMVLSWTSAWREKALVGLGITRGARLMLSTPPAIARSSCPAAMPRAALAIASSPEPHSRFTVAAATVTGRPASSALMRATLRLSSPAWLTQPT